MGSGSKPSSAEGLQLVRLAGAGGAGAVYEARLRGAKIAAKLFEDTALRDAEVSILRRVGPVWSPGWRGQGEISIDGAARAYLLLDWVEGATIDGELSPSPRERVQIAWEILHGVGRALSELHAAGVRHGDVKPSNVLWRRVEQPADAPGHAAATLVDASLAQLGDAALRGYSPGFAAPELTVHPGSLAADLFALGRTVACVLSNTRPQSEAAGSLLTLVVGDTSDTSELASLLSALLSESPGQRPSAAFVADRAARALGLTVPEEERAARRARAIRAAYFRVRAEQLRVPFSLSASFADPLRSWLAPLADAAAPPLAPASRWQLLQWVSLATGRALSILPAHLTTEDTLGAALVAGWLGEPAPLPPSTDWVQCALNLDGYADSIERADAPEALRVALAERWLERGELGRLRLLLATLPLDVRTRWLHAELARREGDRARARAILGEDPASRAVAARLAWDDAQYTESEALARDLTSARASEVRALCRIHQGDPSAAAEICERALPCAGSIERARLLGVRALSLHAAGESARALEDFLDSQRIATDAGARAEEATAATGAAVAAADLGRIDVALEASTRAALLWNNLAQPPRAARALLARANALLVCGATAEAREAAESSRALADRDPLAALYADLAVLESVGLGAEDHRAAAIAAQRAAQEQPMEIRLRVLARTQAWGLVDDLRALDASATQIGGVAAWDWFGHRARTSHDAHVLAALEALDPRAPADVRLFAYDNVIQVLRRADQSERAGPWLQRARHLIEELRPHIPSAYTASFAARWQHDLRDRHEGTFKEEQWLQIERLTRLLHTKQSPEALGSRALDALLLWTGAERGLLLLEDDDGVLRVQVARNVAQEDLSTDQLVLSQTLARRALERGEVVIADVDPLGGETSRSIHALHLRSILVVPLLVHGEAHGVLYLDDRSRQRAFADLDRAWLRALAAQVAHALQSAREHTSLAAALARAERAEAELASRLAAQQSELSSLHQRLQGDEHALRGQSAPMVRLRHAIARVAQSDLLVLVRGESGTGKELVARALHAESPRAARAFVSENCAALPETLLESTLFGHVRGAFTGAVGTRAGLFEQAHRGTLFLDEIGEMSLAMQAKLLRVLETGELRPVGGERTRKVDVRVVAATHRDLEAMVRAGTFRQDLWFRLAVVELMVPPLRERAEDIPLLVAHFLRKYGAPEVQISREVMELLTRYAWPGNVRQLENEVRKLLVFAEGRIEVSDLSAGIAATPVPTITVDAALSNEVTSLRERMDALEAQLVVDALERTAWNRSRAAELLGVSRFGLQKMIRRLGLRPPN